MTVATAAELWRLSATSLAEAIRTRPCESRDQRRRHRLGRAGSPCSPDGAGYEHREPIPRILDVPVRLASCAASSGSARPACRRRERPPRASDNGRVLARIWYGTTDPRAQGFRL